MFESNSNVNSHSPTHQTSPPNHFSNITDHYHHQNPSYAYLSFPSHLPDDDELFLGTVLPYSSPLTPIAPPVPPPPPPPLPAPTAANNHTSCDPGEQKGKEKGKRKRAVGRVAGSGGGGGGGGGECGGGSGGKTKRRRGKTDRHSKIHTAKGPRDRRMRLSLQIARKFFDLQDMLGFDKASKTIEWLFNKSKAAIKDLAERSCTSTAMTSSSPSSDPDINVRNQGDDDVSVKDKKKKGKKGALLFQAMRENREKARARARERTKEKLIMMQKQGNNQNPNAGSSSSTTTIRGDQVTEQSQYGLDHEDDDHQHHQLSLEDQMASVGIIEKYLTISSSTLFNFHHENHDYQHLTRVPSSSYDLMMSSNEINFASFPANWVTQDMNMCSNHIQVQNPNCGLIGRPYNQGN